MANEREAIVQRMVRQANLSQELSDLVVYCQPVPFDIESKLPSLYCLRVDSPVTKTFKGHLGPGHFVCNDSWLFCSKKQ